MACDPSLWNNALVFLPCQDQEGSTVVTDYSGNGYDYTVVGDLVFDTGSLLKGNFTSSHYFYYTTDHSLATGLHRADNPLPGDGGVNGQTWEVWIQPDAVASPIPFAGVLFEAREPQPGQATEIGTFWFGMTSNRSLIVSVGLPGLGVTTIMSSTIPDDQCTHQVCVTRLKTDRWRLYLDGIEVANTTSQVGYVITTSQTAIGMDWEDWRRLPGIVSEWQSFSGRIGPILLKDTCDSAATIAARWECAKSCGGSGWNVGFNGVTMGGQW